MNSKAIKITGWVFTGLACAMTSMSGIMKLIGAEEVTRKLTEAGVGDYIPVLGIMELLFAALFLYPKTMKVGFLLLTCYFAGAMATDLSHGITMANSAMVLSLIWIAAFLRDRSIFLPEPAAGRAS